MHFLHRVLKQLFCSSPVLQIALLFERANVSDSGLNSLVFATELEKKTQNFRLLGLYNPVAQNLGTQGKVCKVRALQYNHKVMDD